MARVKAVLVYGALIAAFAGFMGFVVYLSEQDEKHDERRFSEFCGKLDAIADQDHKVCIKDSKIVYQDK